MAIKISEHTCGGHIYMRLQLPSGRIEEIDVFLRSDGIHYRTTADQTAELRQQIIDAFHALY